MKLCFETAHRISWSVDSVKKQTNKKHLFQRDLLNIVYESNRILAVNCVTGGKCVNVYAPSTKNEKCAFLKNLLV